MELSTFKIIINKKKNVSTETPITNIHHVEVMKLSFHNKYNKNAHNNVHNNIIIIPKILTFVLIFVPIDV